jgi:hypothetical protein
LSAADRDVQAGESRLGGISLDFDPRKAAQGRPLGGLRRFWVRGSSPGSDWRCKRRAVFGELVRLQTGPRQECSYETKTATEAKGDRDLGVTEHAGFLPRAERVRLPQVPLTSADPRCCGSHARLVLDAARVRIPPGQLSSTHPRRCGAVARPASGRRAATFRDRPFGRTTSSELVKVGSNPAPGSARDTCVQRSLKTRSRRDGAAHPRERAVPPVKAEAATNRLQVFQDGRAEKAHGC